MSCSWFPGACLVVAMLAGPASLMADEQIVDEIETLFLEAEESKRIADGWVEDVVVTGDRSIRLTGERDQVQQAIGAVMLADQRFADNDVELARSIARVYSVKHTDPRALASLINSTGPDVRADPTLQVVVLSGRVEQVESAMAVLAELDVAREVSPQSEEEPVQRDVAFDVYLVVRTRVTRIPCFAGRPSKRCGGIQGDVPVRIVQAARSVYDPCFPWRKRRKCQRLSGL